VNIKYHCDANSETGYHAHSKAFWSRLEKHHDGHGIPITIVLDTSDHPVFYANYEGVKICYNVYESTLQPGRFFNHIKTHWDYFWCPSEWQRDCTIAQGYPADRVHVVPEGVDGKEFFPVGNEALADKFTFIIVGKYEYRKATEEMINYWLETFPLEQYPDIKLVLSVDNMFDRANVDRKLSLLTDPRIEILHFPPREEYINRLQTSHVFLSCSRSEGWNLPLIEAIACGIPSICTNNSAQIDYAKNISYMVDTKEMKKSDVFPGEYFEPDFDQFKSQMKYIYDNWDECRRRALMGSSFVRQAFSWERAIEKALFYLKLIEKTHIPVDVQELPPNTIPGRVGVSFIDGVRFEVSNDTGIIYDINFIDKASGHSQYRTELRPTAVSGVCWASPAPKYFINWKVEAVSRAVESIEDSKTLIIKGNINSSAHKQQTFVQELNLRGQRVFINLDSKALGDNIAWIPYVELFQQKHNCKVVVSTFWNSLFESMYPELEFSPPGSVVHNLYAQYKIGCFDNDWTRNKDNWREIPMQKVATDVLGLNFVEIRPKIAATDIPRTGRRYVCISDHSTMQSKYWNNPGAWQQIVDYLGDIGYDVIAISKDPTGLKKLVPINNRTIEETSSIIKGCDFFIGVGSGLSWLAWGLNKKVIMISGFSDPFTEFTSDNYRLTPPPGICHGCFNDSKLTFDRGWDWCPRNKDYECTKLITPEMVKEKINLLMNHL
jgi:autotransporter strand-loop-strand O-heptosyltransferase